MRSGLSWLLVSVGVGGVEVSCGRLWIMGLCPEDLGVMAIQLPRIVDDVGVGIGEAVGVCEGVRVDNKFICKWLLSVMLFPTWKNSDVNRIHPNFASWTEAVVNTCLQAVGKQDFTICTYW